MSIKYNDLSTGKSFDTPLELINEYILKFGDTISKATKTELKFPPLDADGFTSISRGSATVGINVDVSKGLLILISNIISVPEHKKLECLQLLLELNFSSISGSSFAINKQTNTICIISRRDILNLDYDEFEDMLHSVATLSDEWDDRLIKMFG